MRVAVAVRSPEARVWDWIEELSVEEAAREATCDLPGSTPADSPPLRIVSGEQLDRADAPLTEQEWVVNQEQWRARLRQVELRTRQLLVWQEAEHRRLTRQLHDGPSQMLAAICMRLHAVEDLGGPAGRSIRDECLKMAEQTIRELRELSFDLWPSLLDDFGLQPALRGYLDRLAERSGLSVNLVTSTSLGPLPDELETACFRVVQEVLTNVIRHAGAQHVRVELQRDAESLQLTIRDDGSGFDPQAAARSPNRFAQLGLTAMRQRVELLGGNCCIESRLGRGTTIQVRWPLGDGLADGGPLGPAMREAGNRSGLDADGAGVDRCCGGPSGRRP